MDFASQLIMYTPCKLDDAKWVTQTSRQILHELRQKAPNSKVLGDAVEVTSPREKNCVSTHKTL